MYFKGIVVLCFINRRKHRRWMAGKASAELSQIICAMIMSAGGECVCVCVGCVPATWPIFWTVCSQRSGSGLRERARMQTGMCGHTHVGMEEGEFVSSGRSLSGGIKALLQW